MNRSFRALGCMCGAAGGDSLGASVEFMDVRMIHRVYGEQGIQDLDNAFDLPPGVITDDTQQALATAEGLVTAMMTGLSPEVIRQEVWRELKRWHKSQSIPGQARSPGGNSMGSLSGSRPGTIEEPLNHSNSCGSVMRVHPVGIAFAGSPEKAFMAGMNVSVLTHGGSEAVTAGGAMASLISLLMDDIDLESALAKMMQIVEACGTGPIPLTSQVVKMSIERVNQINPGNVGDGGWSADSALAIAILAARRHPESYHKAVCFAVNHSGDSDSTGSMAGAIVGTLLGIQSVPRDWCDVLERRAEINRLANVLIP